MPKWLITGLIILLFGAASIFAYKYYQLKQQVSEKQPTPSTKVTIASPSPISSPSPVTDPTTDWRTYNNGNFLYSLKYPSNWATIPSVIKGSKTEAIGLHGPELQGKTIYLYSNYPQTLAIPFLQIESFTSETLDSYNTGKQYRPNSQNTIIDGVSAITNKQATQPEPGTNITKEGYRYSWFVFNSKTNTIYNIICYEDLSNTNLCTQILSTFKFRD